MTGVFYIAAAVALIAALRVVRQANAMHGLLYLVLLLLALALMFYALGAPLLAALQVLVYAGAIMILFVFAVMMLNLGRAQWQHERRLLAGGVWRLPAILGATLALELAYVLVTPAAPGGLTRVDPKAVGLALFGDYFVAVEAATLLLLAAVVGAYYLGMTGGGGASAEPGTRDLP